MTSNFLTNYDLYTSGNEVNRNYHIWTSLGVLASLVSRRVWINLGYFSIYPNLYIVLLGPPGNKKTTAMRIGRKLVERVDPSLVSADCQSAQDTVKMLADNGLKTHKDKEGKIYEYSPLSIFATELSQFIEIDPSRMIDLLVTIYDCDTYTKRTLRHNVQQIINPCLNLIGCTTPSWVTKYLRTDIITGGFSRRSIFVLEDYDDRRVAFPVITEEMKTAYNACLTRAFELTKVYGEFSWDPELRAFYEHWYNTRTISSDSDVAPFDRTKYIQVLKVAMLLTVARGDELVLRRDVFDLALAMVDNVIAQLPSVFRAMGRNQLADVSSKLLSLLAAKGGLLLEREALATLWKDANAGELYQVINHLVSTDQVVRIPPHLLTKEKAAALAATKGGLQQSPPPPADS